MATKAFMNNESQKRMTDSMRRAGMQYREMGYANGYVAVSPDHPLHGIDYDRVYDMTDISVWGGLTFSETAEHCRAWNSDCIEMIDGGKFEDIPADWWVFGFDTMYFNDGPHHDRKQAIDYDMAQRSLGSLGGGNHFIELDEGKDGTKYLVIHSGSRNLGKRVCEYWQKRAEEYCAKKAYNEQEIIARLKANGRQREIAAAIKEAKERAPKISKDLTYIEGRDASDYLYDMRICQTYADINRQAMADIICASMEWTPERQFTTIHNYIDTNHLILRKGAVSALRGEELIIPMNMRDGSLLCIGKGNLDWLYSAPHGAGRLMSRKQCLDNLKMEDFEQQMAGIYSTSVCRETIDESPMAYKPMQEIIDAIGDTVQVVDIIKPIYNFKAKTPEKPDWKAQKHKLIKED